MRTWRFPRRSALTMFFCKDHAQIKSILYRRGVKLARQSFYNVRCIFSEKQYEEARERTRTDTRTIFRRGV
jgi:hypothetical protein